MMNVVTSLVVGVALSALTHRENKGNNAIFSGEDYKPTSFPGPGPNGLAKTPPMGWMSWERFRCEVDCDSHPNECINENLYRAMTDRLVADGYLAAGYSSVSIDDCWEAEKRDSQGRLAADPKRFPSGMKALGDYMHSKGVEFGIYSDEGTLTCGGYVGSKGFEKIDADTFASWGVDYLKLDGCYNDEKGFAEGYPAMGAALQATGRNITYSCSWPAYLGNNETTKPYAAMVQAGCNLWRNWDDIDNTWASMVTIIDHWGDYGLSLQQTAGPGAWHDPDMILCGDDHYGRLLSLEECKTQMSIWSLTASPLIMSNDLRTVPDAYRKLLLNKQVIAVDQDPLGALGRRISPKGDQEVWARTLSKNRVAVGLLYKNAPASDTCTWEVTEGSYVDGSNPDPNIYCGDFETLISARESCCSNRDCAGFSINLEGRFGCLKRNQDGPVVRDPKYNGYRKKGSGPAPPETVKITFTFDSVGFKGSRANVVDLWTGTNLGVLTSPVTLPVAYHSTVLLSLTPA